MVSLSDAMPQILQSCVAPGDQAPSGEAPSGSVLLRAALVELAGASKVARAWKALVENGLDEPAELAAASPAEVQSALAALRASLAPRVVRSLQELARAVAHRQPDWESDPTESIRDGWLRIAGLGPATVDRLLLEALGRPAYPVDRATVRVLYRHGWLDPDCEYEEARSSVEAAADRRPARLLAFSALIDEVGRRFCKPARADCRHCPLAPWLPEGGPRSLD
jgi:endonuclease III-like uncharacterized protein